MTKGAVGCGDGAWPAHVGYSARVADQPVQPQLPDAPPSSGDDAAPNRAPDLPPTRRERSGAQAALPWVLAAMVALILAASGGLLAAWVVATMQAVPPPVGALPTPTPGAGQSAPPSGLVSPQPSDQPRHTPTPSPVRTQEPPPFTYVVQRGDSVTAIADMFQVNWEDIVGLNDLKPPKYRIFVGQELLIPGYGIAPTPKPGRS